jgi:Xaa-Pro dipeptidase
MPVYPSQLDTLYPDHLSEVVRRTEAALAASGYDGLLLQSGDAHLLFLDDHHYPYRAHAPFKLWAPLLDAPGSFIHFTPGSRPRLVFHKPTDFWYLAASIPASWWPASFDIVEVDSREAARAALPGTLGKVAYIGDAFPELATWGVAAVNPEPLLHRLDYSRARKTAYELECLREANRIGARGHRAAEGAFRAGGTEYDIHQAFVGACGQREQELPYNAIVALNESASVLHYQVLQRTAPPQHRSLLLDAGAGFAGYGSDITRTVAFSDPGFQSLVDAMERLQLGLCARVKPGVDWRDIHLAAVDAIAGVLAEAGILRCSAAEAVENGVARLFFPHGIGHLLGLQVHDVGGTLADETGRQHPRPPRDPALRLTRVLQPGFVVTMEPGLYFIDALLEPARHGNLARHVDWNRVDAFRPFGGVRIEDDLAVTADGCENLTRNAFRALAAR